MLKKIIIGVVSFAVLILVGWRLFFSQSRVDDQLKNLNTVMEAYHMECNMEIGDGEDIRNFYVCIDFKDGDRENFRISLTDKDINQEQILLRNKDGVYVLTPVLNQVYTFKGDYPLNSPKPYLYHSFIKALESDYEVDELGDGYLISYNVKYDNQPNWSRQEMKLSKDLKPVWSYVYDVNNQIAVKVLFTKVDFAPTYEDDFFSVDANMNIAKENVSTDHVSTSIDDLPLIPSITSSSSTLKEQTKIVEDGKTSYILTYEGDKSYTVFQTLVESHKEEAYQSITLEGNPLDMMYGIAYTKGKSLSYIYHDVSYEVYSNDLTVAEMVEIVTNMEREGVK